MGHISMRLTVIAALVAAGTFVSACSGTDVELKGGVFDLMGISGSSNSKSAEPKLAERQGLVVPPSTASLPKPGEVQTPVVASNGEAFPVNPEDAKKADLANVVEQHKAFCEQARRRVEAGLTPIMENSPWGSCQESVLRNFTGKDLAGNKAVGAQ
jgi:hypothetical protein